MILSLINADNMRIIEPNMIKRELTAYFQSIMEYKASRKTKIRDIFVAEGPTLSAE